MNYELIFHFLQENGSSIAPGLVSLLKTLNNINEILITVGQKKRNSQSFLSSCQGNNYGIHDISTHYCQEY